MDKMGIPCVRVKTQSFTAKGQEFNPGWENQDPTSLTAWLERKQNKMRLKITICTLGGCWLHHVKTVIKCLVQRLVQVALRHSSYIIINPINIDIGFLPKIQRRGVILDWHWGLLLRFLSCNQLATVSLPNTLGRPPSLLSSEVPSP